MANPVVDPPRGPANPLVGLRAVLPTLRPSERRIAQFFIDEPDRAARLPVAQLAEHCGTSTTSVVRFCRSMGYAHLRDLRAAVLVDVARESVTTAALPDAPGDLSTPATLEQVVAKICNDETMSLADTARCLDVDELQRAVDLLGSADRVDVFGVGASSFVGLDFQQKLNRIGRTALNWADPHAAWTAAATFEPHNVALAISHSGATGDTGQFLAIARERGASTIAITNHAGSPITRWADVVLTTAARESAFRSGALGSRLAQLMVVDCLFMGLAQAHYEESLAALRATYQVIHRRQDLA